MFNIIEEFSVDFFSKYLFFFVVVKFKTVTAAFMLSGNCIYFHVLMVTCSVQVQRIKIFS